MFSSFMMNAWEAGTLVAIVAGVVGFFTVLRGSAFAAHAIPNSAFAGAALAAVIGFNAILGLAALSILAAASIAGLSRGARRDVATALAIVMMLGLGALFLSLTTTYAPQIYALLFGDVLGVSQQEILPTALLGLGCVLIVLVMYRLLLLTSVVPDIAQARAVSTPMVDLLFLLLVALATTMAVPVVGSLLIFTLLISPAAAASSLAATPFGAILLSVALALVTIWSAIALAYTTNLPIGFFVGAIGLTVYVFSRGWSAWNGRRLSPVPSRPMEDVTVLVR